MKKNLIACTFFLSIFLLLIITSGCAMAEHGVTDKYILIGISNAQSGPASFLGRELSKGIMSYFNYVNNQGGINGRELRVIQYDDGYEPDQCIINTERLIKKDKVLLLLGYVGTPTSNAAVPVIQREKTPYFFPFTGAGFLRDVKNSPYVFNLRGTYDMETEAMVDYLFKKGKKKIAIFYQDDSYGRAGLNGTRKALLNRGLQLAGEGTYKRNTTRVNKGIVSIFIKSGKPDAVIMIGTYKPCAKFIKNAKRLGYNDVDFFNISFVGSKALAKELGEKGDGVIVTQVVPFPWNSETHVVNEYRKIMGADISFQPGFVNLEGFLDAKLLVEILKQAGPDLTKDNILETVENIKSLDLGSGDKISFSPQDHQGFERVFMTEIRNLKFQEKK
ncbi:MAG: ABC transporter substrate-binding protein [Desulfobacterales bacterium]|nr:ABC transporter substrate-binding protein [Desulfobacterales bacterium]